MKVFSLWQPWASLWIAGAPIGKGIETRGKGTKYRGVVAVQAALHYDEDTIALCYREPFRSALEAIGFDAFSKLPFGKILGTVVVTDCLRMVAVGPHTVLPDEINIDTDTRLTERERAFGVYEPGRFAWITAPEPRARLAEPIRFRGAQGLRELPPDVAEMVAAAAPSPGAGTKAREP